MPLSFRINVFDVNKGGKVLLDGEIYNGKRLVILGDRYEDNASLKLLDKGGKVSQFVYLRSEKGKDGGYVSVHNGDVSKSDQDVTSDLFLGSEVKVTNKECGLWVEVKGEKWVAK